MFLFTHPLLHLSSVLLTKDTPCTLSDIIYGSNMSETTWDADIIMGHLAQLEVNTAWRLLYLLHHKADIQMKVVQLYSVVTQEIFFLIVSASVSSILDFVLHTEFRQVKHIRKNNCKKEKERKNIVLWTSKESLTFL